jgi:hypothetical protein
VLVACVVSGTYIGDAAGGFDALGFEEGPGVFDSGIVSYFAAAVGLDVDLVDVNLAGDFGPGSFEVGRLFHHALDLEDGDVDGDLELGVCRRSGVGGQAERGEKSGGEQGGRWAHGVFLTIEFSARE